MGPADFSRSNQTRLIHTSITGRPRQAGSEPGWNVVHAVGDGAAPLLRQSGRTDGMTV